MTQDPGMIAAFRKTLETLADHQGPHGEIPSNVDPRSGRVGYGYRFDGFANVLASLPGVAPPSRRDMVSDYIERYITPDEIKLLPAFSPVIKPVDKDWDDGTHITAKAEVEYTVFPIGNCLLSDKVFFY
jgi:hypothetical protein